MTAEEREAITESASGKSETAGILRRGKECGDSWCGRLSPVKCIADSWASLTVAVGFALDLTAK